MIQTMSCGCIYDEFGTYLIKSCIVHQGESTFLTSSNTTPTHKQKPCETCGEMVDFGDFHYGNGCIKALRARVGVLSAQVERLTVELETCNKTIQSLKTLREKAEAERDKYRAALTDIATLEILAKLGARKEDDAVATK